VGLLETPERSKYPHQLRGYRGFLVRKPAPLKSKGPAKLAAGILKVISPAQESPGSNIAKAEYPPQPSLDDILAGAGRPRRYKMAIARGDVIATARV
jgi:hypothetical protein